MGLLDILLGRAPAASAGDASAVVSREAPLLPVYDAEGRAAHVPSDEAAGWLARGWRQTSLDLPLAVSNLGPSFAACQHALGVLAAGAAARGGLGRADLLTAEAAVAEVANALHDILISARTGYPVEQGTAVAMRDTDGQPHNVDPGQVAHYRRRGWREEQPQ